MKEFLSVKEVASIFGVCKETVYSWIKEEEIPAVTIKGNYFIPRSYIDKLLGK